MHASMKRVHVPGSGKVHIAHRRRHSSGRFGRLILITSGLLIWTALPRVAHAQGPAFLVKDINSTESSAPADLTSFDGKVFFSVRDLHAGPGLWRSDGTAEGTARIKAGMVSYPTPTDNALFFRVGSAGQELWSIDRSEAAVRLKTILPGSSYFRDLTAVGSTLFFVLADGSGALPDCARIRRCPGELWKTDGTVSGTARVDTFSSVVGLTNVNGTLLFLAGDGTTAGIWKSDGTEAGTVRVVDLSSSITLTGVNGTPFFVGVLDSGSELWRSDGTVSGTARIATFSSFGPYSFGVGWPTNVNDTFFFVADDGTTGAEIWTSDGTEAGTVRVTDFPPSCPLNCGAQEPSGLTGANGTLFFAADVYFAGDEGGEGARIGLWQSDGTAAGTRLVWGPGVYPDSLVSIGGTLYFLAWDPSTGVELWRSDGTQAGTVRVKDIHPGPASSNPSFLTDVDGTLFFWADDGSAGWAIWKSDGTEAGTVRVADILHDSNGSNPTALTDVNGTLLFFADDGHSGAELWRSDGTAAGTRLVKNINPAGGAFGSNSFGSLASETAEVHGTLFFTADDGSSGAELWRSDGSESGTVLVKDINPGAAGSYPINFTDAAGTLFFWADEGRHAFPPGLGLYKSDGTRDGTGLVDINAGSRGSTRFLCDWEAGCQPEVEPRDVNGTLFFRAYDEDTGFELWKTDGSAAGTVRVKDINPGMNPSYPRDLTDVDGTLFFVASDGSAGPGIWKSDGTEAGTVRVTEILAHPHRWSPFDLIAVNGTLFFAWDAHGGAPELWRSDGTAAGTVPVRDLGPNLAIVSNLTNLEGALVFIGSDQSEGTQLWRSDGTEAGTVPVKQLEELPLSTPLTNIDGLLLFALSREIWRSDGTEAGTCPIQDLGPLVVPPSSFTLAGGRVFFSADVGGTGTELWALPLATSCRGACSGNGAVTIGDLITAVNIALGRVPLSACQSLDANDDGSVTVGEIVAAVNEALHGYT